MVHTLTERCLKTLLPRPEPIRSAAARDCI
jgi:hypothetical protein